MSKYKNLKAYIEAECVSGTERSDLKDMILRSALYLLGDCAHNFDGDANITERVSEPLRKFNEILDMVE